MKKVTTSKLGDKKNKKVDERPNRAIFPLFGVVRWGKEESLKTAVGGQSSIVTKIHHNDNI